MLLYFNCVRVAVCVLCLFLAVSWAGLWSLIEAFSDHNDLFLRGVQSMVDT